jgi:catechol 2,3-dioxygenase-like lactoylglutathione lyase family enzyme
MVYRGAIQFLKDQAIQLKKSDMKYLLTTTLFIFSCIFISCKENKEEKKEPETEKTTPADSTAQEMQGEDRPADANMPRSEINDFKEGYAADTVRVSYRGVTDTLIGLSKNDTVNVEGDIMIVKLTGNKGAGTMHNLWLKTNGRLVIPYLINPGYANPDSVEKAIKMWTDVLPIKFVKRTFQDDYLEFTPSDFTRSFVGRTRFKQPIELASWAQPGNIAHEIAHSLGLYHEQSRSDRDTYVEIKCPTNPNFRHAYIRDPYARDIGPYNYGSIMHYAPGSCMTLKQNTPEARKAGQRVKPAGSDIAALKFMYKL